MNGPLVALLIRLPSPSPPSYYPSLTFVLPMRPAFTRNDNEEVGGIVGQCSTGGLYTGHRKKLLSVRFSKTESTL